MASFWDLLSPPPPQAFGAKGLLFQGLRDMGSTALQLPGQMLDASTNALRPYGPGAVASSDYDPRAPLADLSAATAMSLLGGIGTLAPAETGAVLGSGPIARAAKTERFNWPVRTEYGKTIDMPISVNPSRSMIQRELAQAPYGDVRALKAPSGDVYLWPANEAMHVDIANNLDLPFRTRADLQKSSYLFNKSDVDKIGSFGNFDDLIAKLNQLGSSQ